jgi:hypothetical protein
VTRSIEPASISMQCISVQCISVQCISVHCTSVDWVRAIAEWLSQRGIGQALDRKMSAT